MDGNVLRSSLHSKLKSIEIEKPASEYFEQDKDLYPEQRSDALDDDQLSTLREVRFKDQHGVKIPPEPKEPAFSPTIENKSPTSSPVTSTAPAAAAVKTDYEFFYEELERELQEKLDSTEVCRCVLDPHEIKHKYFKKMDENTHLNYLDYAHLTRYLVDNILKCALEIVENHLGIKNQKGTSICTCEMVEEIKDEPWCSIESFTIHRGKAEIFNFLTKRLVCEDAWLLAVEFMGAQNEAHSDLYFYEAVYSIPSKMYPIPQATATIFFTIEACKIVPKTCPISVTCAFEGSMVISQADELNFTESQLLKLATAKINFFKSIKY